MNLNASRFATLICTVTFFLSGASALTYEILWQRQMFLIFGASAPATTAILTAIFLGIAVGSRAAVPLMRRFANPLRLYASVEAVIGLWGLLVPTVLSAADMMYVSATAALGEGYWLQYPLRFLLAIVPLLPATLAMGATIPVMVRCVARPNASGVAWAYGVNILGAVVGCLATGLFWIRILGLLDTRLVAVGCNAAAVVLILLLDRVREVEVDSGDYPVADAEKHAAPAGLIGMYFMAGFVALGLEVVWLRFLGIVNTNSTATFTLTLTIYLLGMGLGSLLLYPLLKRRLAAITLFSLANGGTACGALTTFGVVYLAASINHENITLPADSGTLTLADVYRTEATIIAALMFVPTLFMGLAYPAVCDSFEGAGPDRDRWVGRSYFIGTLGSVVGILLVAMVIIPWLGLHGTFSLLVCISSVLCWLARDRANTTTRHTVTLAVCLAMIGWSLLIAWDPRPPLRNTIARMEHGVWREYPVADGKRAISRIVRIKAGASATVMIKKPPRKDEHLVYMDDQLVASTNLEAKVDALMLAHLPLLLHPNPDQTLTVGFGSGGTSQSMTVHGVETYCVEIEPEVPRSAYLMEDQNAGVLSHPQFHLILNDARDHLHAGTETYDVIATDVTNLQYKQNGNLYTVEYFALMRNKLNPDGIACAWIPMASIDTVELRILMNSFRAVFPHATLWFMNNTHTNFGILIGTPDPLTIDYRRLADGFGDRAIADDLKLIGMVAPLQLVHCLHLDEDGYRKFCGDAPLHTDDRPILEFSSPMSFYQYHETFRDNFDATLRLRPDDFRSYVSNLPPALDADFEKHRVASASFCDVLLQFYRFVIEQRLGHNDQAIAAIKRALEVSKTGIAAWPDDAAREDFYKDFLLEGTRWMQREMGL